MKNIILLGPPASGKGSQGKILSEKYDIPCISTGDILRDEMTRNTDIGITITKQMNSGFLIPSATIIAIVMNRIAKPDCVNGYILDGFPRTIDQAEFYEDHVKNNMDKYIVFALNASQTTLIERMRHRSISHGRIDDNDETFLNRLSLYENETKPLVKFYTERNVLTWIDAEASVYEVTSNLIQEIFKSHTPNYT